MSLSTASQKNKMPRNFLQKQIYDSTLKNYYHMLNPKFGAIIGPAFAILLFLFTKTSFSKQPPEIQLANIYHSNINLDDYLVSEKLDGVRAYFDGKNLVSREGNIFRAPKWFTANFPNEVIEGELWIGRGKFEQVSAITRKENANDKEWQMVKFMLFDMPKYPGNFAIRLEKMKELADKSNSQYLKVIDQFTVKNHAELAKKLDEFVKNGAEGLMLHKKNSFYKADRNDDLLKFKPFLDEEAKVIEHVVGKGKYQGMMGAILVENEEGIRFKIGSGFDDQQRKFPPKIGSIVTYKYFGKTKNNKPRFPIFIRVKREISN